MDAIRLSPPRRLSLPVANRWGAGEMNVLDFGDSKRPVDLVFVHANGFNAMTYRSLLASVTAPGIVLQGRLDRLVPVSGVAQLAQLQPDWTLHLLDGIGHVPQIEAPRLTADLLLPWLSTLSTAPLGLADLTAAGPTDLLAGAS